MGNDITVPSLGDGIETADVLEVLVEEGDTIEKEQGIVELETDKATAVVPATEAGRVTKVHVSEGDTVPVGAVLLTVEGGDEAPESEDQKDKEDKKGEKEEPEESTTEKETASEDRQEKQAEEEKSEPAKAKQEDKVTQEEVDSTPEKPEKEPVEEIEEKEEKPTVSEKPDQPEKPEKQKRSARKSEPAIPTGTADGSEIPAGPAMRRFAREVGVDLSRVEGTGQGGRITRDDILRVVRAGSSRTATGQEGEHDEFGRVRREKMSRMRRTIAKQMHKSWTTVPRVTNFDDADVTDLDNIRKSSKADYAARGIKLTSMPFVIKAVAMALRDHPVINASLGEATDHVIYKEYINIGVAVDTDRGLVVPSLRQADHLSIPEIAKKLGEMAEQVRGNNFTLDDLRGSTFTISNLGAIGGTYSTPIINVPETAILLVGRSRELPSVFEDKIVPRLMMPLSISYDHRLIDGAAAARFLNDVIAYLEAPSRLLLAP